MIFRLIQFWSRDQKTISQPANHNHSDQGHESEEISLSGLFFCHEIGISLKFSVGNRDGLDFHLCSFGEGGHLDASAGGFVFLEKNLIDRIHASEIIQIGEIHRGLDDVPKGASGGLQNGFDIFDGPFGFIFDFTL